MNLILKLLRTTVFLFNFITIEVYTLQSWRLFVSYIPQYEHWQTFQELVDN